MLSTSMRSCLRARRRKILRSELLKLFSRCLVFIVISYVSNVSGHADRHHQAVVRFVSASFEGGKKSGVSSVGSLNFQGLDRLT